MEGFVNHVWEFGIIPKSNEETLKQEEAWMESVC